ncbi:hypothetical protein KH5_06190 [Urechidicola sp. KH5]
MNNEQFNILTQALKREKLARKQAEKILEEKSLELYKTNQNLSRVLNETEIQLEALFKTIPDPYILIDLYGNVLKMNNASIDFFGYNIEKESFNVLSVLHKEDFEYGQSSFKELLNKGFFKNFRVRVINRIKELKWIEINASVVYDEESNPTFAQGIIRDITANLKAQSEREKLLKNLTKSNQELNDFAHVVSHDLKAPLRSMNTLVNWIMEDSNASKNNLVIQNFGRLLQKIDKMDNLIDGILEYASIDKEEIKTEKVNLNSLVSEIIEAINIPSNTLIEIKRPLPVVSGDKFKFYQLFQNLISNAIKFSDKPDSRICIRFKSHSETKWEFSVEDNGIGIEKKYFSKIFKVFQSLDTSKNSTGVGLSIVKKIITLYEGDIWLESTPNKGSIFYFTLPK